MRGFSPMILVGLQSASSADDILRLVVAPIAVTTKLHVPNVCADPMIDFAAQINR